ncbi:G2/mitotic-specific cyclin-B3, partial [Orycteropus afer afer]|uniref:G2/mitotic-specific cyclin-B3 n=1 Tax=Orycteropus afer afer TaxID=1230840 RepID=A0AC54ZDQ5_ORYAF
ASQSQLAQPKKEASKEFVDSASKKINRSTLALGLSQNNELNIKRYKLEPLPVIGSTALVSNIMEKPLFLEIPAISKTPTTEQASLFKKSFILGVDPTTEETTLIKRPLSLKKCTNHGEMSLLRNSLSLHKVTDKEDEVVMAPITLRKKHETEEAATTNKTLSLKKKIYTHQRKQSFWKELLTLPEKINVVEDSFFMEPVNFRKKPKTEEATPSKKLLPLKKKKHTTQGKTSCLKKPLVLQKITYEEKSLIKEPLSFKEKPATEESLFQNLSALHEKHTTLGDLSILKKSLALRNTPIEESLLKDSLAFKKKCTIEATTFTVKPLSLGKKCTIQGKISHLKKPLLLQKTVSEINSVIEEPLFFKKKPTIEESLFLKPWASQESVGENDFVMEPISFRKKHITKGSTSTKKLLSLKKKKCTIQGKISVCRVLLDFQGMYGKEKESFFMEPMSFRKKLTSEEAAITKTLLPLKKKQIIQGKMSLRKPLVFQKTVCEEELLLEKLFKQKPTTEEESLFQDSSGLQEKRTFLEEMSLSQKQLALQEKTTSEEKAYSKEPLALKEKLTTEKEFLFQEPFSLHEKPSNKYEYLFQKVLFLLEKTYIKEKSLKNLLTLKEEFLIKEPLTFKEKPIMVEELLFQKPLSLQNNSTNKEDSLFQQPLTLREKTYTKEEYFLKKLMALQDKTTIEEKSLFKKPLNIKKKPSIEMATIRERQLFLKKKPTAQGEVFLLNNWLVLQENISSEEKSLPKQPKPFQEISIEKEALFKDTLILQDNSSIKEAILKEPLALQEKPTFKKEALLKEPTIDTEAYFKEPLAFQEKYSIEKETLLKEPTVDRETYFKEPLTLQEKRNTEKEALLKEPLDLQEKPNIENESLFKESLALQEKPTINEAFSSKDLLALSEKPTTGEFFSKEPLFLQDSRTTKEHIFLKALLISQDEINPHLSSTTTESRTGKTSIATMSSVCKSSTPGKSSVCEYSSNKSFSPQGKRTQKEQMTSLEDIDKDNSDPFFNSIYAKDIFSYMKEREEKFILKKYMNRQTDINSDMRAILVDWLVEVQMTFEMSHETLYLAVKLVDHYLMEAVCKRDKLQLLGSTAFLIAAKFEETCPPCVDDFLYICDDVYQRDEVLAMEISILKILKFDINIPTAYHFLRRYARHSNDCPLLVAVISKQYLTPTLEYYTGYKTSDLHPLVRQLNMMLTFPSRDRLKTVYSKYSHQIFFEVTKIPPLDMLNLEEIFNYY